MSTKASPMTVTKPKGAASMTERSPFAPLWRWLVVLVITALAAAASSGPAASGTALRAASLAPAATTEVTTVYDAAVHSPVATRDGAVSEVGPLDQSDGASPPSGELSAVPAVFVATEAGLRGAGDGYASAVIDGGRADGETVFAGHGEYRYGSGDTVVPEGTTLKVYSPHGGTISDSTGLAIEQGRGPAAVTTYGPGSVVPNYTLKPPLG